jgi:hypothetical protein
MVRIARAQTGASRMNRLRGRRVLAGVLER